MRRPRALAIGGFLVIAAETVLGAMALLAHGPIEIALYLFACAAVTALVTAGAIALLRAQRSEGGGGGGARSDDPEPPWWPDFEAQFWRRVREREPV